MKEEQNHFIKNIEIKNFKCFKDFKAEGFGRVNLIGGKNNVGKTAFMEAVYINTSSKTIKNFLSSLHGVKFRRENLNLLEGSTEHNIPKFIEQNNKINVKSNKNNISFIIEELEGQKKYIFEFNGKSIKVNINDFSFEKESVLNINLIDNFGMSNNEIIQAYSAIQKKDDELYLNKVLNIFDKNIEVFKIIDEKPQCRINGAYLEITELGDGVRHLVSIVTSLYNSENGYLFIDEIDNGIHYTMLNELWKIIFEVSLQLNIQVFATTHSKESIESYARVAKQLKNEDITFIKMTRLDDSSIMAGVRDYKMIQSVMEDGHEVRGW